MCNMYDACHGVTLLLLLVVAVSLVRHASLTFVACNPTSEACFAFLCKSPCPCWTSTHSLLSLPLTDTTVFLAHLNWGQHKTIGLCVKDTPRCLTNADRGLSNIAWALCNPFCFRMPHSVGSYNVGQGYAACVVGGRLTFMTQWTLTGSHKRR